jgi:hypothetical protein
MGGKGSGYWYRWNTKATTEAQKRIDVRLMRKWGYLRIGSGGSLSWTCRGEQSGRINYRVESDKLILDFHYRHRGGEWSPVEQNIFFDWTPCNFGGYRLWFLCPKCVRRVLVLYCAGKYFLCRHCYGLTYSSQQESEPDRLLRIARKIRKQVGGGDDIFELFPEKPKSMHWQTYHRLRNKAERSSHAAWVALGYHP